MSSIIRRVGDHIVVVSTFVEIAEYPAEISKQALEAMIEQDDEYVRLRYKDIESERRISSFLYPCRAREAVMRYVCGALSQYGVKITE